MSVRLFEFTNVSNNVAIKIQSINNQNLPIISPNKVVFLRKTFNGLNIKINKIVKFDIININAK